MTTASRTDRYPTVAFVAGTLGLGGAERQLFEQCRILVDAGVPPIVLSLTSGEPWEERLIGLGVEVVWVGRSDGRLARVRAIVGELRGRRFDVIQAVTSMVNLYAVAAGRILRRPAIGALRTSPEAIVAEFGRLGLPTLRWPAILAGNSAVQLDAAVALGVAPDRIRFVPNLLDLDRLGSLPRSASPSTDVVFIGRLGPEKRIDVLLDAVAELHRSGRHLRVAIVGGGPLAADLLARAERLGISGSVSFEGQQPDPERFLADARLLALTSDREGTPNVVLEAMAMRTPVVATQVGDLPEILGSAGAWRLVPVGDASSLAAAIATSLDDPAGSAADADAAFAALRQRNGRGAVELAMDDLYAPFMPKGAPPCVA